MKLIPVYLMVLFLLAGCWKQEIAGQVFIVTQGMGSIKLPLVEVGAIPQEEFDKYLQAKQSVKLEQQKQLLPKYNLAKKEVDEERGKWLSNNADSTYEKYSKVVEKNRTIITEYEAFNRNEYILSALPTPIVVSKSDAEGKFSFSLPRGKYVITANASRKVVDTSENYHWLVQVNDSTSSNLMLSNDNLLETKCNECIKI